MAKLAEHYVEIKAKLDKFDSGMSKVQKTMKGLDKRTTIMQKQMASKFAPAMKKAHVSTSGLNRGLSTMAKRLIAIGVAYFGARAVFRMSKSFLDVASSVEQFQLRLESLLGSQKAATEAMDYFNEIAAKVPFTLQEIIESGTIITAMGADLKKWTPILTDLAAVMGMKLPEAASALGRAFAGGAGAADIFRERGILQIIKDSARMKHDIEDITKLTLPEFRDVMFEAFTDPTGKMAGASEKLAKTWVGTISMLQDKWFQFRTSVMEAGVFELLKEGLASFDKKLDEFIKTGQLDIWAKNTAVAVIEAFKFILEAFKGVAVGFEAMQAALIAITTRFTEMLIDWSEFVLSVNKVTKALGGPFKKEHEDLIRRIDFLKNLHEGLNETFDAHVDKIIAITEKYDPWIEKLKEVKEEVENSKTSVKELGEEISPSVDKSALAIRKFHWALDQVQPTMKSYIFGLEEMVTAQEKFTAIAINEFMAMESTIKGFVEAILNSFEKWAIGQIMPKIMAALPFPLNLLATGAAIASIRTIFAKIKGLEEGGIIKQEGIYHLHPNEMVLPVEKAPQIIKEMASPESGFAPATIQPIVNIYARNLDRDTVDRAAEMIHRALEREGRRRG